MFEVSELQSRRADNQIWSAAKSYGFEPVFKAYTDSGEADIYWNCIIGSVRRHYDYPKIEKVFRSFQAYEDADLYEGLLWLGMENCVYAREVTERPFLRTLRQRYAEEFLRHYRGGSDFDLYGALASAHWKRVLGKEPRLSRYDIALLDELEFSPELTTEEIAARAEALFEKWFHIRMEEKKAERKSLLNPFRRAKRVKKGEGRYHRFGIGFTDHPDNAYGGENAEQRSQKELPLSKLSESELREFMAFKYGKSIYRPERERELEKELCRGDHAGCHLHFTRGEKAESHINNGFEALQREQEAKQRQKNRQSYNEALASNRSSVNRLAARIQNSVLLYLHPTRVRSDSGTLNAGKLWRGLYLDDERIFTRTEQGDMGDLSVDILLDASTSQRNRQEAVSAQGYMIAEALKKCGVPCRVMSFCSMTGYTIMKIFTDYGEKDNTKIFDYVANGCNRDGLAIRAAGELIKQSPCEHKILIILSDVKPNDVVKIKTGGEEEYVPYVDKAGIENTAREVRSAKAEGICVICVFTGEDEDVPAAKTVYGRDFARIRSLDRLADTVGTLLQNQIRNL